MSKRSLIKTIGLLQVIEKEGFPAYIAGPCLERILTGNEFNRCEIITEASFCVLKSIFPDLQSPQDSGAESSPEDIRTAQLVLKDKNACMTVNFHTGLAIRAYLDSCIFTCDAAAMNRKEEWIERHDGKHDLLHKTIDTIEDPKALFQRDPVTMMTTIRYAAESGFTIADRVRNASRKYAGLLRKAAPAVREQIRDDFITILTSDHAGHGLEMLGMTDTLQAIIGLRRARIMKTAELRAFKDLWTEMDNLPNERLERICMFYLCFEGRNMAELAEQLPYDDEVMSRIQDAQKYLPRISMIRKKQSLLDLIDEIGLDRYRFLDRLTIDQAKAYGLSDKKSRERAKLLADQ